MLKRELYLNRIRPLYHNDLIKVLVGMRRCGKSILLMQIKEELLDQGIPEDHIIYMNFENMQFQDIDNEKDLYNYIEGLLKDKACYYLFFDEIQYVKNFEVAINSFRATHQTSIFITGSNGKLLSGELATYLTGRYMEFHIYPFTFHEFCEWKNDEQTPLMKQFEEYQKWGGMPQVVQLPTGVEKANFLNDLYSSILTRDVMLKGKTLNLTLLRNLFQFMVDNIGKTFSSTSVIAYLKSRKVDISYPTLQVYLDIFCSTMMFQRIQRYDIRGKKILSTLDKYYLTDIGLHNVLKNSIQNPIIENLVCNELQVRGYKVFIGKTYKGEVDFIATRLDQKIYVQACYMLYDNSVVEREFSAFTVIKDNYSKYVISLDTFDFSRDGIKHLNLLEFLNGEELV